MLLSVVIATFNEQKNILRCLKSVYDWVNEIVIVDGQSTDKTTDLIRQFDTHHKIKLFVEDNPPIFHINKQKAIERCQGKWILQLDADEVVSKDLKSEILNLLKYENRTVAYRLSRLNFFSGKPLKKGCQYPDYTTRLYKNGVARFPCKSVHEQVTVDSTVILRERSEAKDLIGYLKNPLLHYPYPTFEEYLNKWNRYTTLDAEELKRQNFKPSFLNFIRYFFILPKIWFFKTYVRHLGFLDGFAGFLFSLFSAIRYWVIYIKAVEKSKRYNT